MRTVSHLRGLAGRAITASLAACELLTGCASPDSAEVASELTELRKHVTFLTKEVTALEADLRLLSAQHPCLPPANTPPASGPDARKPFIFAVFTEPPDATVFIDGRKVGRTPVQADIFTDVFSVRVEKSDYVTERRTIDIRKPGSATLAIGLTRR